MSRTVANIYHDTRELLNNVKETYEFKSDDQAIRFMCNQLLNDDRYVLIREYLETKKKDSKEGSAG